MERRLAAILAADMADYSRLMEADEQSVIERQKAHRSALIDPTIARFGGRIVKTTGDGLLAEFASAQDAVRCAIEIQAGMAEREAKSREKERIRYRIGINLGDVVFDEGDIFGDGVNVAARLEGLAEPGGVCVSDLVHQVVQDRIAKPFRDLGQQRVKNISRAIRVWQWTQDAAAPGAAVDDADQQQQIRFCTAPDGVQIAWASVGEGLPVFKAPNWLNHIEYEWRSPFWRPTLTALTRRHRLVRFDQRGNGLSDWEVPALSEDTMIGDMASVVDAAGLDRFALLGLSQGCAFSIRYAVERAEQVRCLILLGGYARGRLQRGTEEQREQYEAGATMIRLGWGSTNPAYRHFFTSTFMPHATAAQSDSFDELQRLCVTTDNALKIWKMNSVVDVSNLASKITVPTLVLHYRGDRVVPMEEGRRMAAMIPGAQFIQLEGDNHIPLEGSPGFDELFETIDRFVGEHAD